MQFIVIKIQKTDVCSKAAKTYGKKNQTFLRNRLMKNSEEPPF